jgi:glycerate kinase
VLVQAARAGARHCIVGIGGSATNDGGFGMARALGWGFLAKDGQPIECWTKLTALDRVQPPPKPRLFPRLSVAVDVQNPLLGARGASRVYGPQKGLKPEDFPLAEACLRSLAKAMAPWCKRDFHREPGAGAAGGLGFGLMAFLGATPQSGFELFAASAKLARLIGKADVVITGEGCIDHSTLMGKGVGEIAQLANARRIPCLGLAGVLNDRARLVRRFAQVGATTELTSPERAKSEPSIWLERLAQKLAKAWTPSSSQL